MGCETLWKAARPGNASKLSGETGLRVWKGVHRLFICCFLCACTVPFGHLLPEVHAGEPLETGKVGTASPGPTSAGAADLGGCQGGWVRPVRTTDDRTASEPVRKFDRPAHDWLPGHRGVDLAADQDALILAPEAGAIVFAGTVSGKSVVSIRHGSAGSLVSTFEPARTSLHSGDRVERGAVWGTVQGHSDHCDGVCLHWGLRTVDRNYLNPMSRVDRHRILLKPG